MRSLPSRPAFPQVRAPAVLIAEYRGESYLLDSKRHCLVFEVKPKTDSCFFMDN